MDRGRAHISLAVLVAAAVVVVDQFAKAVAAHTEPPAHNPGLALGVARGPAGILVVASILMLAVFVAVIGRWAVQVGISPSIPALIAGGFAANVLDRARFGAVRDFLATPWAIVNVADIAVVGGVIALGVALVLRLRALHVSSCRIVLDPSTLRASIVRKNLPE
jgi:lipoprotein signal peptidase